MVFLEGALLTANEAWIQNPSMFVRDIENVIDKNINWTVISIS